MTKPALMVGLIVAATGCYRSGMDVEANDQPGADSDSVHGDATPAGDGVTPPATLCPSTGQTVEVEPNPTFQLATRMGVGPSIQGSVGTIGDEDWFVFAACGESILRVVLTDYPTASTPVDYDLRIVGRDGAATIGELSDGDGTDAMTRLESTFYVAEPGDYYLQVRDRYADEADTDHPYTLTATFTAVPDAAVEPNGNVNDPLQNAAIATPISVGTAYQGYIAWVGDEDWLTFDVPGEKIARVELTDAPAYATPVDYNVDLYGPDARASYGNGSDGDGMDSVDIVFTSYVPAAGKYYLHVNDRYSDDADPLQPYSITVTLLDVPDAANEPNGNASSSTVIQSIATPLTLGSPMAGYLASNHDEDWYSIDIGGETLLDYTLTNAPANASPVDYVVSMFAPDAATQLNSVYMGDGMLSTTILHGCGYIGSAATYYLRVSDRYDDDYDYTNPFALTVTAMPVPDAAFEPNGNTNNPTLRQTIATPVACGAPAVGFIASLTDDDWYKIDVPNPGSLHVELTNTPVTSTPVDYCFTVYDSDASTSLGSICDNNGSDGITQIAKDYVVLTGYHYIQVYDSGDDDWDITQSYSVTATCP